MQICFESQLEKNEVVTLYEALDWACAKKPDLLIQSLNHSTTLVSAREAGKLVGLCNALSDGCLVVYYSHFLVHPECQGQGIGRAMMDKMQEIYGDFHQQILVADEKAVGFYKSVGFSRAGKNEPMWIFDDGSECRPPSAESG